MTYRISSKNDDFEHCAMCSRARGSLSLGLLTICFQYPSFLTPNPSSGGDKSAVPNGSANGSGVNANGNGGIGAPLDAELGSDYEAIDGTLFGWWKNVVRKSLR